MARCSWLGERLRPEQPFDVAQGRPEPVEGRGAEAPSESEWGCPASAGRRRLQATSYGEVSPSGAPGWFCARRRRALRALESMLGSSGARGSAIGSPERSGLADERVGSHSAEAQVIYTAEPKLCEVAESSSSSPAFWPEASRPARLRHRVRTRRWQPARSHFDPTSTATSGKCEWSWSSPQRARRVFAGSPT